MLPPADRVFPVDKVFSRLYLLPRVFHDEEHSTESGVLEISSNENVVHDCIRGFQVSSDVAWIKMKNLCYQGCHFGYG